MYEQPTSGHRFGPALIAFLVVLAAAAGTIGYFGARRIVGTGGPAVTSGTKTPGPTTPATAGPADPTDPSPTRTTSKPDPIVTVPPGDGTTCPQQTRDVLAANGLDDNLKLLLYVRASQVGFAPAEVWICQNADDLLIYQGHVLSRPITDTSVSLLLADGIRGTVVADGDGYLATNPNGATRTEYSVTRSFVTVTDRPSNKVRYKYTVEVALP